MGESEGGSGLGDSLFIINLSSGGQGTSSEAGDPAGSEFFESALNPIAGFYGDGFRAGTVSIFNFLTG